MNKFLLTTLTIAALAVPATAANAATPLAQVAANSTDGMTYFGTNSNDSVTFALVAGGSKILVDNVAPLQINAGCLPVAGDLTKATCTAFTASGTFKPINAFGLEGADTIVNTTQIGMIAKAGGGKDKLVGALGNDQLFGEAGDFDTVQGGGGNDVLSGGAGLHDLATYSDKAAGIFAVLKEDQNTRGNGVLNQEDDQINSDIEDLGGGIGADFLNGNSLANTLAGGIGNDTLVGGRGADTLVGGDGDDLLLSNAELFGPLFDGAADSLNGSAGEDTCGGAPSEGDTRIKCEF